MILATINYIKKTLHISASKSNYQRPDLLEIHASGIGGSGSCKRLKEYYKKHEDTTLYLCKMIDTI